MSSGFDKGRSIGEELAQSDGEGRVAQAGPGAHAGPDASTLLGESHAHRLAAIIESSDDAIISKDLNGIIATWNTGAEKIFGYTGEDVIGQPITILFPPDLVDEEAEILARIRRGERVQHFETFRCRKDGTVIPISLTISPIHDARGRVIGASKIAQDMTARKQAEERQNALHVFTDRLFRSHSGDDVYEAALDAILRALACERAAILLFDEAGVARFIASRGLSAGYRQAVEGHSPWARDAKDPRPITIADIEGADLEASLKATVKGEGIAALAFIPVATKTQVLGKLMAYYPRPHDFTRAEIDVAVTIARQFVFSLERIRAEASRSLILSESQHRIKNTLATVQAIASQTLRHVDQDAIQMFLRRLHALGRAHDLLATDNWHEALLSDVVDRALQPFASSGDVRMVVDCPSVLIPANTSLALTLCLHELATNAVKYGALSNNAGRVHVSLELARDAGGRKLRLNWQERGGPPVRPPERNGFGSRLIHSTGEAGTHIAFDPDGVKCTLELSF